MCKERKDFIQLKKKKEEITSYLLECYELGIKLSHEEEQDLRDRSEKLSLAIESILENMEREKTK